MAYLSPAIMSLTEPSGTQALTGAASWLQDTMLGSVATVVAVLAVAAVGAGMLMGRVNVRRGLTVVMGCFVLFGSAIIAGALVALVEPRSPIATVAAAQSAPSPLAAIPKSDPVPYDPYAGASVAKR